MRMIAVGGCFISARAACARAGEGAKKIKARSTSGARRNQRFMASSSGCAAPSSPQESCCSGQGLCRESHFTGPVAKESGANLLPIPADVKALALASAFPFGEEKAQLATVRSSPGGDKAAVLHPVVRQCGSDEGKGLSPKRKRPGRRSRGKNEPPGTRRRGRSRSPLLARVVPAGRGLQRRVRAPRPRSSRSPARWLAARGHPPRPDDADHDRLGVPLRAAAGLGAFPHPGGRRVRNERQLSARGVARSRRLRSEADPGGDAPRDPAALLRLSPSPRPAPGARGERDL